MSPLPLLVVLLGPTGSGKTELAIRIAGQFGGEILSCDSVAVYRGMDVGAAKPSAAERAAIPHHLLDIADPNTAMTAGDWARQARETARSVAARGLLPVVTGGTGLYLRAFLEGLAPLPPRCPVVRSRLAAAHASRGPGHLHRMLRRLDAPAAARIHASDTPKLIRAIEIALLGKPPQPAAMRDPLEGFRIRRIGLAPERPLLYERLNRRAAAMFEQGLMEETQQLQAQWGADAQALGALGYREAAAVLAGQLTPEAALAAVQQGHRNYAKRQMTWFRREPDVVWLEGFGSDREISDAALRIVEQERQASAS